MGIVFNSGLQVALLITAAAVLAGIVPGPRRHVVFPPLELAVLGAAAIMAAFVTADGEATWIEGLELVAIYVLAALVLLVLVGATRGGGRARPACASRASQSAPTSDIHAATSASGSGVGR